MRALFLPVALLLLFPALANTTTPATATYPALEPPGAGVKEALFDSTTLRSLLKDRSVVAIRFYNVLVAPTGKEGTAMAIGIRTDGSEVNKGKSYQVSLGFMGGRIAMSKVAMATAAKDCQNMQESGNPSFSSSFTRTDVEALLDLEGCSALRATASTTSNGSTTFLLTAMRVADGKAVPLGSGGTFERVCGYPCPTVCGPDKNYVYRFKQ